MTELSCVPFAEPPYLRGIPNSIYKETHLRWQRHCREFIGTHLIENGFDWEKQGSVPESVFQEFAKGNMLLPCLGSLPVKLLKSMAIHELPTGIKVEDFDWIHTMIYADELGRTGSSGPSSFVSTGFAFGIPPYIHFGSDWIHKNLLPDLIHGRKRCCIAVTEPEGGSDVANIQTTATLSQDGKFFIVRGRKKWITNGLWAHLSAMAVRTGGPGPNGISLLAVPLVGTPGVTMRRLPCSAQVSAGTTYIELDDVQVPVEHLIGQLNHGMKYIMTNFNHERLFGSIVVTRQSRVALGAAFEYCTKREAFGKTLMDQPVVRHRLAKAGALLESLWSWLESLVYSMTQMTKGEADTRLGGITAMVKAHMGVVLDECAKTAVLLFGGQGFTKEGRGEIAEMIYREVMGCRIPGGSEDVMWDVAIRQLAKLYEHDVKKGISSKL